jgi:hypothetical protein
MKFLTRVRFYIQKFININILYYELEGHKTIINAHKTIENAHKTIENAWEGSGTVNGHEHLGTIGWERSNALERIVENGHAHAPKTKETLYIFND